MIDEIFLLLLIFLNSLLCWFLPSFLLCSFSSLRLLFVSSLLLPFFPLMNIGLSLGHTGVIVAVTIFLILFVGAIIGGFIFVRMNRSQYQMIN